jgi:murein hydrolase activator
MLWFFLCILLLHGWTWGEQVSKVQEPPHLHQKQQELKHIQRQLVQYQQQLRAGAQQEHSLLATLDALSVRQEEIMRGLHTAEQEIQLTHQRLEALQQAYTQWSQRVQQQRQLLVQRLRYLYKLGRLPYAKLLLSAQNVTELTYKVQYMRRIAVYDRQQIQRYQDDMEHLEQARQRLEAEHQHLLQVQDTLQQQQTALTQEQQRKRELLHRMQQERHAAEQAIAELAHTAKVLTRFIEVLRQASERPTPRTTVVKGHTLWPVEGPILSSYGRVRHRQLDIYTMQNGVYIGAPLGSDINSIGAGTVVYAGWFKGFGRLLILDHGDQVVSLYGHTSAILVEVGDTVQPHQVVAKVGDSGAWGEPALYFEIRHRTVPQDPLLWLRQRSARLTE